MGLNQDAPTFLYIDYGPAPHIGRELRYSLATLLAEFETPRVVVYTDKPQVYARLHPCVTPRPLGADLARWTREGAYNHRAKPCVLLDALRANEGLCVLLEPIPGSSRTSPRSLRARPRTGRPWTISKRAILIPRSPAFP